MSTFIFLDTNNWIYLSNGFNVQSDKHDELHLKIFASIKKRVEEGKLVFLVNDIVIEEWNRNKSATENQIKEIKNKYKSYNDTIKAIKDFIQDNPPEASTLQKLLEDKLKDKVERHENHIREVEDFLLNKTTKIHITDKNKIEASNLAIAKKAPFVGDKKNSMADALILLSSIEHLQVEKKIIIPPFEEGEEDFSYFPESFFVSSNKGDFSDPTNKEKIHPDLEEFLDRTQTKFFFTLGKLINFLESRFLTEDEEELIEHADERRFCEICDYEHYPTIEFSEFFKVFDPNKQFPDPNQLKIEFKDFDYEENNNNSNDSPFSKIRTGDCDHCGAEFIQCTCGELVHINEYNSKTECLNCGNNFIVHADIDKKGMAHNLEYEMIEDYECKTCGQIVESVDDSGNCEDCAEYEISYLEN